MFNIGFDCLVLIGICCVVGIGLDVCEVFFVLLEMSYVVFISGFFDVMVEVVCCDIDYYIELMFGIL